jgi:hypothetical protein
MGYEQREEHWCNPTSNKTLARGMVNNMIVITTNGNEEVYTLPVVALARVAALREANVECTMAIRQEPIIVGS